jgi:site-specific DNA recombinase
VTRAAIYARYSTELQSGDSTADQIARCREYAVRQGLEVVLVEEDAGISGATRHNRPGLLRVLAAIDS